MSRRYYKLPPLTSLATFETAARHRSFKGAAEELGCEAKPSLTNFTSCLFVFEHVLPMLAESLSDAIPVECARGKVWPNRDQELAGPNQS